MMFPPIRGSKTVSAIGASSRVCSGGLKSPNRSVNREGLVDRPVDDDLSMDHSGVGQGHDLSSVGWSAASVTMSVCPASARFQ